MINKDITFIYYDGSEKAQFDPIAKEAIERGYNVCRKMVCILMTMVMISF